MNEAYKKYAAHKKKDKGSGNTNLKKVCSSKGEHVGKKKGSSSKSGKTLLFAKMVSREFEGSL